MHEILEDNMKQPFNDDSAFVPNTFLFLTTVCFPFH